MIVASGRWLRKAPLLSQSQTFQQTPTLLSSPRFHHSNAPFPLISSPLFKKVKPLNKLQISSRFYDPFKQSFNGFSLNASGFAVKAQNESDSVGNSGIEEAEVRGESSMPERFRYLTKEVPDKRVRWPLLIGWWGIIFVDSASSRWPLLSGCLMATIAGILEFKYVELLQTLCGNYTKLH